MSTTGNNNAMTNRALWCAYNSGDEMHVQKSYDPYREFPYSKKKNSVGKKRKGQLKFYHLMLKMFLGPTSPKM